MLTLVSKSKGHALLLGFVIAFAIEGLHAQGQSPLTIGELIVTIDNAPEDAWINIEARTAVRGSRTQWYPVIPDRWSSYSGQSDKVCQFIDRDGGPNADTIGYAKYRIYCMSSSNYVDIDYRDADFETSVYADGADVELFFDNNTNQWQYEVAGEKHSLSNHASMGIWELWFHGGSHPRIPIIVRNYYNGAYGGTVVVDNATYSSPDSTKWTLGNHTITAPSTQGGSWWFDHWSDGGAETHTVTASLSNFATVYTAYYWHDLAPYQKGAATLACYPNPSNPAATIVYTTLMPGQIRLSVVDVLGREVAVLTDAFQEAGPHHALFDGSGLASGIYFCRLRAPVGVRILRMLLTK